MFLVTHFSISLVVQHPAAHLGSAGKSNLQKLAAMSPIRMKSSRFLQLSVVLAGAVEEKPAQ